MKILAPHDNQQGWMYVRVKRTGDRHFFTRVVALVMGVEVRKRTDLYYDDSRPESRIISSRRVEEAVEMYDYLRLCQEEELSVIPPDYPGGVWAVTSNDQWLFDSTEVATLALSPDNSATGSTLREAYDNYKMLAGDAS